MAAIALQRTERTAVVARRNEDCIATMPDLRRGSRGLHHTIDSALLALCRAGVADDRIGIVFVPTSGPLGAILEQTPQPGTVVDTRSRVVLHVSGLGVADALPYVLRDESPTEIRASSLLALFDTPLAVLEANLRRAGGHFALRPEDRVTSRRWIEEVFGLDATCWSPERWYSIARLLPSLHQVAGTTAGVSLAMALVFELPVQSVMTRTGVAPLPDERMTRLGAANSSLGISTSVGPGTPGVVGVTVVIGPVTLSQFREAAGETARTERDALYRLVLPARVATDVAERWLVAPSGAGRIGDSRSEVALGLNSYLGA